MEPKARANLAAAKLLSSQDFNDSAASRAYYAAYLAVWSWLEVVQGVEPPEYDGLQYWRHNTVADELLRYSVTSPDNLEAVLETDPEDRKMFLNFERLRSSRIKADYHEDEVTDEEAAFGVEFAEDLIRHLLGRNGQ